MTDILVLYYSLHGSTANLAREVAPEAIIASVASGSFLTA